MNLSKNVLDTSEKPGNVSNKKTAKNIAKPKNSPRKKLLAPKKEPIVNNSPKDEDNFKLSKEKNMPKDISNNKKVSGKRPINLY